MLPNARSPKGSAMLLSGYVTTRFTIAPEQKTWSRRLPLLSPSLEAFRNFFLPEQCVSFACFLFLWLCFSCLLFVECFLLLVVWCRLFLLLLLLNLIISSINNYCWARWTTSGRFRLGLVHISTTLNENPAAKPPVPKLRPSLLLSFFRDSRLRILNNPHWNIMYFHRFQKKCHFHTRNFINLWRWVLLASRCSLWMS